MTPEKFKAWRAELHLTMAEAAEQLGISLNSVKHYEAGVRPGRAPRPVVIPRTVELACAALLKGIRSYDDCR